MQKSEIKKNAIKKSIVLTGGGTGGHVIPHLALLKYLRMLDLPIYYIGSNGIEKTLMEAEVEQFFTIPTGKLRRYMSWENIKDAFKVIFGVFAAFFILARLKPSVVFSKGGFVSVPVCWAAYILRIPVVTQESDLTPGLATRLIAPFARTTICAFSETCGLLPAASKPLFLGQPVREDLLQGDKERGFSLCRFENSDDRPVILVMGGSQGAKYLNELLERNLKSLVKKYRIIHLSGNNWQVPVEHQNMVGSYASFSFLREDLQHIFAITDLVISRAGANAIFEFLALSLPMLLIPLQRGSRGDQVQNAEYFRKNGWAHILPETGAQEEDSFVKAVDNLRVAAEAMRRNYRNLSIEATNKRIAQEITRFLDYC